MITVRTAQRTLQRAERHLAELKERAKTDPEVTAAELVEARATVDLAASRLQGAREAEQRAEQDRRDRLAEAGARRRVRQAERDRQQRLEREAAALASGKMERDLQELARLEHSPSAARKLAAIQAWRESGATEWPGFDAFEQVSA
jgi:hypothetical protein